MLPSSQRGHGLYHPQQDRIPHDNPPTAPKDANPSMNQKVLSPPQRGLGTRTFTPPSHFARRQRFSPALLPSSSHQSEASRHGQSRHIRLVGSETERSPSPPAVDRRYNSYMPGNSPENRRRYDMYRPNYPSKSPNSIVRREVEKLEARQTIVKSADGDKKYSTPPADPRVDAFLDELAEEFKAAGYFEYEFVR